MPTATLRLARKLLKLADRLLGRLAARAGFRIVFVYLGRIGEIAQGLDVYVKMGVLGWRPRFRAVVVAPPHWVANSDYLARWRPYVRILSSPRLTRVLEHAIFSNHLVYMPPGPRGDEPLWDREEATVAIEAEWERQGRAPLLRLSPEDENRGRAALREFGMPEDAWFVALHVRSAGYLRETSDSHRWFRNARVETYLPAVQAVTDRGGWVVRLGDPTMEPLPPLPRVVDYPHQDFRHDWLDVYLAAACRFLIGTTSGMIMVSHTFGVPIAATNWVPFSVVAHSGRDVYVPKLYRSAADGRILSFAEMLAPELFHCHDGRRFAELGVEVVDNDENEIRDLVVEMLDRLDGTTVYSDDDEALQARFRSLMGHFGDDLRARIGRDFLRRHADLLPRE